MRVARAARLTNGIVVRGVLVDDHAVDLKVSHLFTVTFTTTVVGVAQQSQAPN